MRQQSAAEGSLVPLTQPPRSRGIPALLLPSSSSSLVGVDESDLVLRCKTKIFDTGLLGGILHLHFAFKGISCAV